MVGTANVLESLKLDHPRGPGIGVSCRAGTRACAWPERVVPVLPRNQSFLIIAFFAPSQAHSELQRGAKIVRLEQVLASS